MLLLRCFSFKGPNYLSTLLAVDLSFKSNQISATSRSRVPTGTGILHREDSRFRIPYPTFSIICHSNSMSGLGDSMDCDEMEWENSFELPDRIIPEPIPVNNLLNLVASEAYGTKPADLTALQTKSQTSGTEISAHQLIIVPDTNIFMSSGSKGLIDQLLNANFERVGKPQILIPWMVLQELDSLNKGPRKNVAQISVRYINDFLTNKHPRVRVQKPTEVANGQDKFEGSNEDDSILQCALICSDQIPSPNVVFLTDDRNLRNKALAVDKPNLIITSSLTVFKEIEKKFRLQKEVRKGNLVHVPKHIKAVDESNMSTATDRVESGARQTEDEPDHDHRAPKRKIIKAKACKTRELSRSGIDPHSNMSSSKVAPRPPSPKRAKRIHSSSPSPSTSVSFRKNSNDLRSGSAPDLYKIRRDKQPFYSTSNAFTRTTDILKDTLSYMIEYQMKEDCGLENWMSSLKIKPPYTLQTALKCIELHWRSIFTFVFGIKGKKTLDSLLEELNSYNKYVHEPKFLDSEKSKEQERKIVENALSLFNCGKIVKPCANVFKELQTKNCVQTLMGFLDAKKTASSS